MMRRWLYHYEGSNAIVRLATLMVIHWSVYAFISSYFGADQPVWQWMNACLILLVCNMLKIALASNPKYTKRSIDHRSTVVRVLVLPLSVVVVITTLVTLLQVRSLRGRSSSSSNNMVEETLLLPSSLSSSSTAMGRSIMQKHPEMPETAAIKVMVFILSAWTPKSVTKRQTFRETTMKLMPGNTDEIAYFYRFIIGQPPNEKVRQNMWPPIEAEMAEHGDVLMLNCSDKYEDLSRKVFSTMEWADQYEFDYLIKTDDDIFVRWETITSELLELGVRQRYWQGLSYW
ncbi:hypothetical protein BX666DRAFT_1858793 [Dichotomocladium elegans]|nr:hypothetical protein BX666DRAFT_1858793 [Dichotomocladium elegans]